MPTPPVAPPPPAPPPPANPPAVGRLGKQRAATATDSGAPYRRGKSALTIPASGMGSSSTGVGY